MKKKGIILCLLIVLMTGCTVVRIDTSSIDNMLDVVLSKKNMLYNRIGIGYKYYIPRGVTYIDSKGTNDRLYSNGVYYYLYLDEISYHYKNTLKFEEDSSKYYSRKLKNGYLEITKTNSLYLIEFVYSYARIEALVPKEDINMTVLNASYILSTIKYNNNIIKLSLSDGGFSNKEEKYDKFALKKETSGFLDYKKE